MAIEYLPSNLQIFDPTPPLSDPGLSSFPLFAQLPPELRQMIWRHSLQQTRMLTLLLRSHYLMDLFLSHKVESPLPSVSQGGPCAVVIGSSCRVLSKLLRVSSEARETALLFYRVHIPCRMVRKDDKHLIGSEEGMLYINPEFDFVRLKSEGSKDDAMLMTPSFIHYVKVVMDPRRVGILNLAIDRNQLNILSSTTSRDIDPHVRKSVTDTLRNLRRVFLLHIERLGRTIPSTQRMHKPPGHSINRSYPLMAASSSFQCIPRDPRAVDLDLKLVYMGRPARKMLEMWQNALANWEVSAAPGNPGTTTPTDIRHLVACQPMNSGYRARDRKSAQALLKAEDQRHADNGYPDWYSSTDAWGPANTAGLRNEQLEEYTNVRPAFGFWLFPVEAVSSDESDWREEFNLVDFTHHWPQLCLWDLN
ncbi:hypothetical protein F4808DRAFT_456525 [Astrocystis sublimbata]|nr:hypothetical protein F4808DRAFT_456525 [Astrocystis sublimbata]